MKAKENIQNLLDEINMISEGISGLGGAAAENALPSFDPAFLGGR